MSKLIIWVLCTLISVSSFANDKNCYPERKIVLFFGNGMFNTLADAEHSTEELKKLILNTQEIPKKHLENLNAIKISYNTNEMVLTQLLQVLSQKGDSEVAKFLLYLQKLNFSPKWFQEMISKSIVQHFKEEQIRDFDLQRQIADYEKVLDRKATPLVVAHSQGNLYANMAYTQLKDQWDGSPRLRIVSVATPASYVAGNGPYVTLESDGVIKYIPNHLEWNIYIEPAGFFDHEFIAHYLKGKNSRERITEYLTEALQQPVPQGEDYDYDVLNVELQPIWFKLTNKARTQEQFSKSECLIFHALINFRRAGGIHCAQRNKALAMEAIEDCQKDPNIEKAHSTWCPFVGGWFHLHTHHDEFEEGYHPECDFWSSGEGPKAFSTNDFDGAKKILDEN